MRKLFTLFFLLPICAFSQKSSNSIQNSLTNRVSGNHINYKNASKPVRLNCCRCGSNSSIQPLLVVDNEIRKYDSLAKLNPDEIESVWILKGDSAVALYGSLGKAGVIIIKTRSTNRRQFIVKDSLDGKIIPGATVTFTAGDQTLMFSADSLGKINARELSADKEYILTVSAIGYKYYATQFKVGSVRKPELLLQRDDKACAEVVVVATSGCRIKCRLFCGGVCRLIKNNDSLVDTPIKIQGFNLYPNPVLRGSTITIETISDNNKSVKINIADLSGKLLLTQTNSA